jgi:hypothetical protein
MAALLMAGMPAIASPDLIPILAFVLARTGDPLRRGGLSMRIALARPPPSRW